MGIDVIKTCVTYLTALIVVAGGFIFLYLTHADLTAHDTQLVIAGFVGMSLQFLFNQQIQSSTAHQTNVAANTLTGAVQPNTLVTTPGPVNVAGGDPTVIAPPVEPKPED